MKISRRGMMTIAILLLINVFSFANSSGFSDVADDYWALNDIKYFSEQGIVNGVGNGKFDPDGGVTREQFAKMMSLAFNAPLNPPANPSFSDVNPDMWSYKYIEVTKNYLTGYINPFGGLPSFRPTQAATREDIAVALIRVMGVDVGTNDSKAKNFKDYDDISPKLRPFVSAAVEQGLIKGYSDNTFRPSAGVTRAESVTLMSRATKKAMIVPGDNKANNNQQN